MAEKKLTLYEQLVIKNAELKELDKEVKKMRKQVCARAEKQKVTEFQTKTHVITVGDRVNAVLDTKEVHDKVIGLGHTEEVFYALVKPRAADVKSRLGDDVFDELADWDCNPYSVVRISKK